MVGERKTWEGEQSSQAVHFPNEDPRGVYLLHYKTDPFVLVASSVQVYLEHTGARQLKEWELSRQQ